MLKKIVALIISLPLACGLAHATKYHDISQIGANPGELQASYFLPSSTPVGLVVLLHGCAQDGQQLAEHSGFVSMAARYNVALLIPQQSDANNIKRCFNWFSTQDTNKGEGETQSIINMISTVKAAHAIDDVYLAGLSAGGAMATSLLANYPKKFKAGAIIAGLPYPCANNLIKAISCMRAGPSVDAQQLAQAIAKETITAQDWPPISVWTGLNDNIVSAKNTNALAQQWRVLSGVAKQPKTIKNNGYQITQWQRNNQPHIQLVEIDNMGHGIAINPLDNDGSKEAPFIVKAPISTVLEVFKFWGLTKQTGI